MWRIIFLFAVTAGLAVLLLGLLAGLPALASGPAGGGGAGPAAASLRVATMGSPADEFLGTVGTLFGPKDIPAMNWVEQLAKERAAYFDFGSLETNPSVRGEPRNDGYSRNWGRHGSAAVGPGLGVATFSSQVAGAAAQIASGDVDFAYIQTGAVDFSIREHFGLTFDQADPGYQAFAQSIFDAIFGAVDTLQAAGTATIAVGWDGVSSTRQDVKDAAFALNIHIWAEAISRGIPFMNLYYFLWPNSPALDPTGQNLMFAGELIPLASVADAADLLPPGTPGVGPCSISGCATRTYAFNFMTHDGANAGTIVEGFMANEFIRAMNFYTGSSIPLLTEQEILANAIFTTATAVEIDIKPGSDANPINLKSKGVIPVAILTTEDFDALTVDANSVRFGPDEAEKRHKRAHVEDVDSDGDLDLLLHFRTQDAGIAPGDTEACLTGLTYDGVPILGCDSLTTVPPGADAGPVTEDLSPCFATDTWAFDVATGQTVFIAVDTVDATTAADLCFVGDCGGVDSFYGDDDFACTFPPPAFSCPQDTFVATTSGACTVNVRSCSSACADPGMANYSLTVQRDGSFADLTLTGDDL